MNKTAPEIHILNHKVKLLQALDGFRTSMDSVFLAAACRAGEGDSVLDMGTGVGGAAFCLHWRVPRCKITGVELQKSHADLAVENIALNNAHGFVDIVCADIREYAPPSRFDHVMCNPPYLEAGNYTPSPSLERAMALGHEGSELGLDDWITAVFRNLKSGGTFTIIHRADMVDKIILGMGKRFGAIEIIPLYPRMGEAAKRVIVRAIKDRKTPARLFAGLVLHLENGDYTDIANAILRDGAPIEQG